MKGEKTIKIFTLEQQFPCGPQSSCCGPIGQSEQEVMALKNAIEKLGLQVEIYDVQKFKNLQEHPQVFKLFRTFGPQAIPIITVGNDVACMGKSEISETVAAIKSKL
ncbi:MAG: hypothetical protein NC935_02120 [Candidatus Omnitrophica bacterium]|nr:hypothetical protein [Candidatus Omnitrophota bacterium]